MGVHGGYGWGDWEISENPLQIAAIIPASFSGSNDVDGGLGGVHLGMNKQFGNFVVGGEFRLSGAEISGTTSDCAGLTSVVGGLIGPGIVGFNCDTNVNWIAAMMAKAGYAQNRWLVYGTLGWAVAGVDYSSAIVIPPAAPVITLPGGENDTADGFAFGGGVEYAVTDSVSFGVEYTRMELEAEGSGLFLGGILTSGDREIELNTVTARLNVKWGGE
jgi:outer membrane immunogenic protein